MSKVFIIAEAGVNHNGRLDLALRMIDVAVQCGADAVKFQTFKSHKEISRYAEKAEYQKITTDKSESFLEMAVKLELDEDEHRQLFAYCQKKGIIFLSTPFESESIDFLHSLGLDTLKISSGQIDNLPYLRQIGGLGAKLILSTGMATLTEVSKALDVLISRGTKKKNITVLQCTTAYPVAYEEVNLKAMLTMRDSLGVKVGYSDHTMGIEVSVAAVAMGAEVIEKHFTLDKNMEGPDHLASLEPDELQAMVTAIRNIEKAMGDGIKRPTPTEVLNMPIARRSIVAARNIRKGEVFSAETITVKSPATGLSPMCWDDIIGRAAKKDFAEDQLIE
jgi:N,N'-diacetyllegionaminate synthase